MQIPILTAEDDTRVKAKASTSQYEDSPLVQNYEGVSTPIVFDMIDYVQCDCVVTHKAMLVSDKNLGYNYPMDDCDKACRIGTDYYEADSTLDYGDTPQINIVVADDDTTVERKASTSQYEDSPLHITRAGVALPLQFDVIDYVMCDCVVSHKAILLGDNAIGYDYKIDNVKYTDDMYVVYDQNGVVTRQLPAWAGKGTYQLALNGKAYLNADNGSLGVHDVYHKLIGTDYVLSKYTLKAED